MEINKDGWFYKIAYLLNKPEEISSQTNLCEFFWRVVGTGLFLVLIAPIVVAIVFSFEVLCVVLFGCICTFSAESKEDPFVPISWWPKVGGHPVMPAVVLLIATIAVGALQLISRGAYHVSRFDHSDWWAFAGFATGALIIVLVFFVLPRMRKAIAGTEAWQILKAYLRARKEKFCPIITFIEKEK